MTSKRIFLINSNKWTAQSEKLLYQIGYLPTSEEQMSYKMINKDNKVTLSLCWPSKKHKQIDFKAASTKLSSDIIFKDHSNNFIISKNIYSTPHKNDVWEIYEYTGRNEGLVTGVNISNNNFSTVNKPDWVDEEVTNTERFHEDVLKKRPYSEIETMLATLVKEQIRYYLQRDDNGNKKHLKIKDFGLLSFSGIFKNKITINWYEGQTIQKKLGPRVFPIFYWKINNKPLEEILIYADIIKIDFSKGINIVDCKYFYDLKVKGKARPKVPIIEFFPIKEMLIKRNYYDQLKPLIEKACFELL